MENKEFIEISNLIKEAKPLYYKRERTKKRIKQTCFTLFIIFAVFLSGYGGYTLKSNTSDYLISSENTTESYIPIDEYGLITVID